MPLPSILLHTIQYLSMGGERAVIGNGAIDNLACWNWGFTGFNPVCVWPSHVFDYIANRTVLTADLDADHPRPTVESLAPEQGRAWIVANIAALKAIRTTFWDSASDGNWSAGVDACVAAVTPLVAAANGLVHSPAVTPYRLTVKYDNHEGVEPSFDHVWLDINGRTIEVFPGMTDIQIYQGAQANPHGFVTFSMYLQDLLPQQIRRIIDTMSRGRGLDDIRVDPHPVLPGVRAALTHIWFRAACGWCGEAFAGGPAHCARCGEVFCRLCLRESRAPVVLPAGTADLISAGRLQVCRRCYN